MKDLFVEFYGTADNYMMIDSLVRKKTCGLELRSTCYHEALCVEHKAIIVDRESGFPCDLPKTREILKGDWIHFYPVSHTHFFNVSVLTADEMGRLLKTMSEDKPNE